MSCGNKIILFATNNNYVPLRYLKPPIQLYSAIFNLFNCKPFWISVRMNSNCILTHFYLSEWYRSIGNRLFPFVPDKSVNFRIININHLCKYIDVLSIFKKKRNKFYKSALYLPIESVRPRSWTDTSIIDLFQGDSLFHTLSV